MSRRKKTSDIYTNVRRKKRYFPLAYENYSSYVV